MTRRRRDERGRAGTAPLPRRDDPRDRTAAQHGCQVAAGKESRGARGGVGGSDLNISDQSKGRRPMDGWGAQCAVVVGASPSSSPQPVQRRLSVRRAVWTASGAPRHPDGQRRSSSPKLRGRQRRSFSMDGPRRSSSPELLRAGDIHTGSTTSFDFTAAAARGAPSRGCTVETYLISYYSCARPTSSSPAAPARYRGRWRRSLRPRAPAPRPHPGR